MSNPDSMSMVSLQTLTHREKRILTHVLDGSPSKRIALEVGVSETQVSKSLAASALKLGFHNRAELVRFAAAHGRQLRSALPGALTTAERGVLELLVAGHSNEEIAARRGRSRKTIENQVSALLRKTGLASRRSLMVAFCDVGHESMA
ncbi:MAG: helix-turn-helix transcriptional regulator [Myxococcales bacterium]